MSINALKEFMIHFHTYRNVDLINQGLYHIRARIYYTENNIKYYAIPYFYSESKGSENLLRTKECDIKPHNIIPNHISENNWEYVSKTFLIRYYDEEVEIDEFCYFRLELPYSLLSKKIVYNIEFELFFSDALLALESDRKAINFNSNANNNANYNSNYSSNNNGVNGKGNNGNVLNNVEFKSASLQNCYINYDNGCPGYVESFNPVIYGDAFFSILNTSVHMVILDYKLRLNNFSAYTSNGVNTIWAKESGNGNEKITDKDRKSLSANKHENNKDINNKDNNDAYHSNFNNNENDNKSSNNNYNLKFKDNLSENRNLINNNNNNDNARNNQMNLSVNVNLKEDNTSNYNSLAKSLNDKNIDLNSYNSDNNYNSNAKNSKVQRNSGIKKNIDLDLLYNSRSVDSSGNFNSLIQFFLNDKLTKITDSTLSAELVDELYESYVITMIKNYFSIRKKYERLMNKLIDDKIKSEYPFFIVKIMYFCKNKIIIL